MHQPGSRNARRFRRELINLVPSQDLVGGNLEGLTDCSPLPEQPDQALAKSLLCVMVQSDSPSPGTITGWPRRIRSTAV